MLGKLRGKYTLEMVVFVSGALVMIFEIVGSRLLAPYIGTSTYIWTSLIGVILGSLSLGYWLGGRAADSNPRKFVLSNILFSAGGLISLSLLLQEIVLSVLASAPFRLEIKAVLAALILFAPASVFFGFVTPYSVRLRLNSMADAGETVGRLYALSTVGSILGTFAAGFVLLPFIGTIRTLYLITAVLFALAIAIAPLELNRRKLSALIMFPLAVGLNEFVRYSLALSSNFQDIDTEYSRVRVFDTTDKETNKPIRVLTLDPFSTQSAIFLDDPEKTPINYVQYYHLLRHFKPDFQNTLLIGGAGYTFPKEYLRKYPGKKIDVVEIDPQMTEIARKYFQLRENSDLRVFHEDGRIFLNTNQIRYDAILIDAFGAVYSVPFQLTTIEAVKKISQSLSDDGVVIVNLISAIEGEGSQFLQAEFKTYQQVFPHVRVFRVFPERAKTETQNLILLASKSTDFPLVSSDEEISDLLKNAYQEPLSLTVPVLTDDLAPVEYYNSFAQNAPAK